MARSLFRDTIVLRGPAGLIPLAGAQVWFYEPNGAGVPGPAISYPLYADAHSTVTLPTPYVTGALGELEVWADLPHRAQIVAVKPGFAQVTETIDLEYPPELSATTDDIADAIRIHEAEEDPHDQYLTQDEADLAYLKLTGGTVTGGVEINQYLYVYGGAIQVSNPAYASLQASAPAGTVRDLRLLTAGSVRWNLLADGSAETGGSVGSDLYIRRYDDAGGYAGNVLHIARNSGATSFFGSVDAPAVTVAGNGVETLNHKGAASGYVPLGADTKIPNAYLPDLAITNTFVVTSEAEMLALNAQTGDVCVRLDTTENYILAAEPATVLANWTKLAASTTAGNTTIVKREEFAPAAASTAVALAAVPTQMLSVSRNGVEQSEPAGHYTVAGVTVTFTDAFVAGERVSVVYEVGSSAPAPINGYTKLESDARYEPIDTMYTKAESDTRYLQPSVAASTYLPLTGGTISGDLIRNGADLTNRLIRWQTGGADRFRFGIRDTQAEDGDDNGSDLVLDTYWTYDSTWKPILRVDRYYPNLYVYAMLYLDGAGGTTYLRLRRTGESEPRFEIGDQGQVRWGAGGFSPIDTVLSRTGANAMGLDGSLSPTSTNTRDLGALSMRWRSAYLGTVLSIAGASATANQITHAITTDAQPRLIVDGNGKMRWGPGAAVAQDTTLERKAAGTLLVSAPSGSRATTEWRSPGSTGGVRLGQVVAPTVSAWFSSNADFDGTNWVRDDVAAPVALMTIGGSNTVPTANQLLFQVAAAGANPISAFKNVAAISNAGTLTLTPDAATNALVGNGNAVLQQPNATYLSINATTNAATSYCGFQLGRGGSYYWAMGHNIASLNSDGFDIYHLAAGKNRLGISNVGVVTLNPDAGQDMISGSMPDMVIRNTSGNIKFHPVGTVVSPVVDNVTLLGHPSVRWNVGYVTAGITTGSSAELKEGITPLDPAACYQAAKDVRWYEYAYLPPVYQEPEPQEGEDADTLEKRLDESKAAHAKMLVETAPARHQRGFVFPAGAESKDEAGGALPPVPDLFGLSDRQSTTPQADLATLGAALQELIRRFEVVEGKVV